MIQVALYQLKKQYGGKPLDIHKFVSHNVNLLSGDSAVTATVIHVKNAVVLPAKVDRHVINTISKISADKATVQGGTFDRSRRTILIDQLDVPDLQLGHDDWIVFRGRRYDVTSCDFFEDDALWVISVNEMVGVKPPRIIRESLTDGIRFNDQGAST
jgi:hypothetical protein